MLLHCSKLKGNWQYFYVEFGRIFCANTCKCDQKKVIYLPHFLGLFPQVTSLEQSKTAIWCWTVVSITVNISSVFKEYVPFYVICTFFGKPLDPGEYLRWTRMNICAIWPLCWVLFVLSDSGESLEIFEIAWSFNDIYWNINRCFTKSHKDAGHQKMFFC